MEFLKSIAGQATVFLTIVGIVATLIAPRLTQKARIYFFVRDTSRIGKQEAAGPIRVQILHNETVLDEPAYLSVSYIENSGSMDITRDEFVEPVTLRADDNLEIISVDVAAPDGVLPVVEVHDGIADIRWSILKPGERINLTVVLLSRAGELNAKKLDKIVSLTARLRNVSIGQGIREYYGAIAGVLVAFVMSSAMLGAAAISNYARHTHIIFTNAGTEYFSLQPTRGYDDVRLPPMSGFQACRIYSDPMHIQSCKSIQANEAAQAIKRASIGKGYTGLSQSTLISGAILAVLYGFTITFFTRITRRRLGRFLPFATR